MQVGQALGRKPQNDKNFEELDFLRCEKTASDQRCQALDIEVRHKDARIEELESSVQDLQRSKADLEVRVEKIQTQLRMELEGNGAYVDGSATPFVLESTVKVLHTQISGLSKVLLEHLKRLNQNPAVQLVAQFKGSYLARQAHVTYMFKAWLSDIFFRDFENESFQCGGGILSLERNERRKVSFECFKQTSTNNSSHELLLDGHFHDFCVRKMLGIQEFWKSSLVSDTDGSQHLFAIEINDKINLGLLLGSEDVGKMIASFVVAARSVWVLHKLCLSFDPRVDIVRVLPGTEFKAEYMDSVVSKDDDHNFVARVGFMISPGFRLRKSFVKSQIYLAGVVQPECTKTFKTAAPATVDEVVKHVPLIAEEK